MVLDFLWTWKVATRSMLNQVAFLGKSDWWSYKALRQLKDERYIQLLPRGKYIEQELWALTDHGFEIVLMDRDDIDHYRYKPHAPAHDFLASCLQLGDVWLSNLERQFFTEQMLASLNPVNFPKHIRPAEGHVPDGISFLKNGFREVYVAYEVDLNLKNEERYKNTFNYLDQKDGPALIIWLVRNEWIAERIFQIYREVTYNTELKERFLKRYAFILLDDFKLNVWNAKVLNSELNNLTIRKLHENLLQIPGKETPKLSQKVMCDLFFPKYKSPQKSITSLKKEVL
jgi:hypothetical protein